MKSLILYGTFIVLTVHICVPTLLSYEDDKYKQETVIAKSQLRQIHISTITYLEEDEQANKMPVHTDFSKILEPYSDEYWVLNELHFYYSPGLKLEEANPEKFVFSFRDIYVRWDGTIIDYSK